MKTRSPLIRADGAGLSLIYSVGAVTIEAAAADKAEPRKFEMVAYTGGALHLPNFEYPVVVDLQGVSGIDRPRPALKDHKLANVVGHITRIHNDGRQLRAYGVVSGKGPAAREVVESSDNNFPWQASIGALPTQREFVPPGRQVTVNGQTFQGPLIVARRSVVREISFTALGADDDTSARIAANAADGVPMTFEQWLEAKGFVLASLSDQQKTYLTAQYDAEIKASAGDGADDTDATDGDTLKGGNADDSVRATGGDDDLVKASRTRLLAEKKRVAAIEATCAEYRGKVDAAKLTKIEASAIEGEWDQHRTELELLRAERPQSRGNAGAGYRKLANAAVIAAALSLSAGIAEKAVADTIKASEREQVMNEATDGPMRGYGLHSLMDAVIHASGGHYGGSRKSNDFIRTALQADQQISASGFTTLSLSGILSNVANKGLIASYNAVEVVWNKFCAIRSHSDFKVHTRYRLDSTGAFKKVAADGELKHVGMSDASFTNQIATYGAIIALTRQMMTNDDLGAFMEIPGFLGRLAALRLEEAVFVLLLSNPSSFFATGNANYASGAGSALSITSLTTAEQKFMDQVDSNNKPVLTSPKILLTGTALKTTAENLFAEKLLIATGLSSTASRTVEPARNPHSGKYPPVISPYVNNTSIKDQDAAAITGQSSTAWWLFADPAVRAAIAVAFLNGQQTPTIESAQTDFNTLGMQWRGFHDFGVGMEDPKAAVLNAGA